MRGDIHRVAQNYCDVLIELRTFRFGPSAWKSLRRRDRDNMVPKALQALPFCSASARCRVIDVGMIDTNGTWKVEPDRIAKLVREIFPLKPRQIIEHLDLLRQI